ncbi:hypothetical protein OG742_19985 [Streptomyces sp. NBC_00828]|uniref:sensor histidine kinase n=1 Tax=Streptomyces sp. NBC_00828 TaxID=2903678 RepID=UPI003867CAAA
MQEALTNVVKHSGARHAAVSVVCRDGMLAVEVVDDGPPFPPPAVGGFGLVGMRERVAAAGGRIDYGPVPAGGFRVRAVLPAGEDSRVERPWPYARSPTESRC